VFWGPADFVLLEFRFGVMTMLCAMPRAVLIPTSNDRVKDPTFGQDHRDPLKWCQISRYPAALILRARLAIECPKCFDTGRNVGVYSRA
jgi:hypothetical protein